jgi:hypothetical protein
LATPPAPDVTQLLLAWRQGDPDALDRLLPRVYAALRRLAHARMRAEASGGQTLQTTALVHEAYVRLVDGTQVAWQNLQDVFHPAVRQPHLEDSPTPITRFRRVGRPFHG